MRNFIEQGDFLTITLKDNGLGFNIETAKRGNGLKNMKTRAEKICCELNLSSSSKGTIIHFKGNLNLLDNTNIHKPTQIGGE